MKLIKCGAICINSNKFNVFNDHSVLNKCALVKPISICESLETRNEGGVNLQPQARVFMLSLNTALRRPKMRFYFVLIFSATLSS